MKRIQDSVHGLIEFAGRESLVIEALATPQLQRLRRVRQLGLAHLVFPAAEHSRFAHAIGSAHVASRFARALRHASRDLLAPGLQVDESVACDLALAGLCHDLGHGPLSHAWDRYVMVEPNLEEWKRALELPPRPWLIGMKWHELVTQACLLSDDSELHRYLVSIEEDLADRVAAILGNHHYLRYIRGLISSDIDVDRADFVLRDALQSGVAYGRYDLDWLCSTLTIGYRRTAAETQPVVGFDSIKAVRAVEQFLVAHSALYDTVYFHKAVQSAETMIGKLLGVVRRRPEESLSGFPHDGFENLIAVISGKAVGLEQVLELDDDLVWVFVDRLAKLAIDPVVRDLASRIRVRRLFRPLPLTRDELEAFLSDPFRAVDLLDDAIASTVELELNAAQRRDYVHYNRTTHRFFERGEKSGYFVNTTTDGREAVPISEHPDLRHHLGDDHVSRLLFVPREALDHLRNRIRKLPKADSDPGSFETNEGVFETLLAQTRN